MGDCRSLIIFCKNNTSFCEVLTIAVHQLETVCKVGNVQSSLVRRSARAPPAVLPFFLPPQAQQQRMAAPRRRDIWHKKIGSRGEIYDEISMEISFAKLHFAPKRSSYARARHPQAVRETKLKRSETTDITEKFQFLLPLAASSCALQLPDFHSHYNCFQYIEFPCRIAGQLRFYWRR